MCRLQWNIFFFFFFGGGGGVGGGNQTCIVLIILAFAFTDYFDILFFIGVFPSFLFAMRQKKKKKAENQILTKNFQMRASHTRISQKTHDP